MSQSREAWRAIRIVPGRPTGLHCGRPGMRKGNRFRLASPHCYACGAETDDAEEFPKYGNVGCLIPCCPVCQKLGGKRFEDSILDRAGFIQAQLRRKYRAHLNSPSWSDEELGEMSGHFPREIRRFASITAEARDRVSWNYERHLKQLDLANDPHEVAASLGIDPDDPPFWWRSLFPGY